MFCFQNDVMFPTAKLSVFLAPLHHFFFFFFFWVANYFKISVQTENTQMKAKKTRISISVACFQYQWEFNSDELTYWGKVFEELFITNQLNFIIVAFLLVLSVKLSLLQLSSFDIIVCSCTSC